jgi:acyl-CoA reductase-like NAD-dependent aldehyde dehydrogenase
MGMATGITDEGAFGAVLRDRHWRLLVGEQLCSAVDNRTEVVVDPSTGQVIAEVPWAGAADVDAVVRAGQAAFPAWSALTVRERARHGTASKPHEY